jgi:hypothetical protein
VGAVSIGDGVLRRTTKHQMHAVPCDRTRPLYLAGEPRILVLLHVWWYAVIRGWDSGIARSWSGCRTAIT